MRRRYCFLSTRQRRCLRNIRWSSPAVVFYLSIFFFFFLLFLLFLTKSILLYRSIHCCAFSSDIIVSLTSTPRRFHHELPLTIHSLLSQTHLPRQIRLRLSSIANLTVSQLKKHLQKIDSSDDFLQRFDRIVRINYEQKDYEAATKFLPIIREYHQKRNSALQQQRIMICDDDQYYHHETIASLNVYSKKYPKSIVGFRGWRIRKDLQWGVRGAEERDTHHVIHSSNIAEPFRTGVLTANKAYLIRPVFFTSQLYEDFSQAPLDVRHVDDIWLNGYAARGNITRYVIPSCCSSISVIRHHTLAEDLVQHGITRLEANNHALKWFSQYWEQDIWYRFHGPEQPIYRTWMTAIDRSWMGTVQWLKFVLHFGFAYD